MNTNFKPLLVFTVLAAITSLVSCEKDDDSFSKPVISDLELGLNDSHVAYLGADLHVEASIVAEGLIHSIEVEIHAEDGSDNEIEAVFDYSDQTLKNTTFHEHIDILDVPTGEYHLHLTVTDKEGNSTTVEEELSIEVLVDEEEPVLTIASAPSSEEAFTEGNNLSISGTVSDNQSLGGMVVALVYEDDNISDADVSGDNTQVIVMLHTHTFDSEDAHSFTASIEIGAEYDVNMVPALIENDNAWKSGNYYILVKAKDAMGNWTYSNHYPIEINL